MKTEAQLRAEVYSELLANTDLTDVIGNRLYWISRPTLENDFPLVTYSRLDGPSTYAFNHSVQSEAISFQFDIYVDTGKAEDMDSIVEAIKDSMENICYRLISTSPIFPETDINKNVKALRWERLNV